MELDPRNKDWAYRTSRPENRSITTSDPKYTIIHEEEEYGILISAIFKLNNKEVRASIKVVGPDGQEWEINATPYELYTDGLIGNPTGIGLILTRYDDTDDVYVMALRPPWPYLPYKDIEISLKNESSSNVTLVYADIARIRLGGSYGS